VLKAEIAKVMSASEEPASAGSGAAADKVADKVMPLDRALIPADKVIEARAARRGAFRRLRARRAMRLAATITIAASIGAIAGSLSTLAVSGLGAASGDDSHILSANLARLDQELAALKNGVDTARKTAGTQLAKLVERLDRTERAQGEPAAKLSKLSEAVERLERRNVASTTAAAPPAISAPSTVAANASAAGDVTGSIPNSASRSATPHSETNAPPKPPVVEGWTLRNVYDGIALVQGRFGLMEVEPGDMVPGIGRIDTIRRQDGRWVVVTSKGLIVPR